MPLATLPAFTPALPEIFLAIAALVLLMVGVFTKAENNTRTVSYASIIVLFVTIPLVAMVTDGRMVTFGGAFVTDTFAVYIKALVLISAAAAILMSKDYLKTQGIERFEFPVLIVLATLGMMMMISANDLLALYLGIELQSLSLYVRSQRD